MNNYRKAGFLLVGVLLIILYFFNRSNIELGDAQPVTMHPISATGGELQVLIQLKNPNLLSSTIKTMHEKFYINGVLLGILDNQINQGIPGLKVSQFPASIRYSNTELQRALSGDTTITQNLTVTIDGDIEFQNLFTSGKITVHQSAPVTNTSHEN